MAQHRTEVVRKGKTLIYVSYGFDAGVLTCVAISGIYGAQERYTPAIAAAGTGIALGGVAIGLAIAGVRRVRNPDRFIAKHGLAIAPVVAPSRAHVGVSFRF